MLTVAQILARVRAQLIDTDTSQQRWTDAELLRYLSDAQRMIAAAIPSATGTVLSHRLVAGTRQQIPADGSMLLGVYRNMGTNGTTPGRAIRIISREIIDAQNPSWHTDPASAVTQNFIWDTQNPTAFFVYPPSLGTSFIEINYAQNPPELTSTTSALTLNATYRAPLFDYVMYRAHQKDSDFAAGQALADQYLKSFMLFIQLRTAGETGENPNLQLTQFDPSTKGSSK